MPDSVSPIFPLLQPSCPAAATPCGAIGQPSFWLIVRVYECVPHVLKIALCVDRQVNWSTVIFPDDVTPLKVNVSAMQPPTCYLHAVAMNSNQNNW